MKFRYSLFLPRLLVPLLAASQIASAGVDIVFDYQYDSSGFFTGSK